MNTSSFSLFKIHDVPTALISFLSSGEIKVFINLPQADTLERKTHKPKKVHFLSWCKGTMALKQQASNETYTKQMDDEEAADLMMRAQAGDKEAYRSLLKAITPRLKKFVEARAGFLGCSDDIVQDILISIHRARHTFLSGHAFQPWMFTIARRRIIDYIRRSQKHMKLESLDDHDIAAAAPVESDDGRQTLVMEALSHLPAKYRDPIELTKLKGLKVSEAAKHLNLSTSAVKSRCSRGYEMLRKKLEKSL